MHHKILVLFPHTLNGSLGSTVRVRELCLKLINLGHDVRLFSPYERKGIAWHFIPLLSNIKSNFHYKLVKIIYSLTRKLYYNKIFINFFYTNIYFRKLIHNNFAKVANNFITEFKPDIIQAELSVTMWPALILSAKHNIPVFVDLHNIEAEELSATGIIKRMGIYIKFYKVI